MRTNWSSIDFSRVRVVSFDLGYTVIGLNAQQVCNLFFAHLDLRVTPAQILLADAQMRCEVLLGDDQAAKSQSCHFSEVLYKLFVRMFPSFSRMPSLYDRQQQRSFITACREYHDAYSFFDQVYPDALMALEKLQANKIRVIAISNAPGTLDRDLTKCGIRDYFEHVLDSGVEGVAKPDPEFFTRALDRCGVAAEEVLHVGDNPTADVQGALAVGMQAALYDPVGMFPEVEGHAPQYRNHMDLVDELLASRQTQSN